MTHRRRDGAGFRSERIGMAVGSNEVLAVPLSGRRPRHWFGEPAVRIALDVTDANGLTAAVAEAARTSSDTAPSLYIALLPPLVHVREIELPPMRVEEVRRVLTRDAERHFVAIRGPQVISALRTTASERGPMSWVAAAVASSVLDAIHEGAALTGAEVVSIAPAAEVWARGAAAMCLDKSRAACLVAVLLNDQIQLLSTRSGQLHSIRRCRKTGDAASVTREMTTRSAALGDTVTIPIVCIGAPSARQSFEAEVMTGDGSDKDRVFDGRPELSESPACMAAALANLATDLRLIPEKIRTQHRAIAHRVTISLAISAMMFLALAGVLELWGVKRELHALAALRAATGGEVRSALTLRGEYDAVVARMLELHEREQRVPARSWAIVSVSEALPSDAFLVGLRATEDSLLLEGFADRAARVFDALQRGDGIVGVRSVAPVRLEPTSEGDSLEHFSLAVKLGGAQRARTP